jgi:serine/threonine-protein kinase
MALKPGDTFGRYTIVSRPTSAGVREVFHAFDNHLKRSVTLELLRRGPDESSEDAEARFLREARRSAQLAHPHVRQVYDLGEIAGLPFIAMEYVDGRTLADCCAAPSVGAVEKLHWLLAAARGLAAAHKRGVIHGDVNPSNILVSTDDVVKVADFGLVNHKSVADPSSTTSEPSAASKVALLEAALFTAPEQLAGADADASSDQFAWGLTAFTVLSGENPRLFDPLLVAPITPINRKVPAVSATAGAVVMKALRIDRAERYPTMQALADELGEALNRSTLGPVPAGEESPAEPATSVSVASARPAAEPGDTFGDFVVQQDPAEARGATVIVVARAPSGELVDVKVLSPESRADPTVRNRFMQEVQALARITSRHSLALIDFGKTDHDDLYFVMEHVVAEGLDRRLARRGPFSIPDAVSYVVQACEAVAEVNDLTIVHGDLSPSSLRLATDEAAQPRIVVVDFALTRASAEWIGPYAAPEQLRGEEADARTDVWGLGLTLFTLLAGDPTGAPALRSRRRDVPSGLEATVARCLEGKRDARFASVRELASALRMYLSHQGEPPFTPAPHGVRDREVRLAWLARGRIAELAARGLAMEAIRAQMETSIVRPVPVPTKELERISGHWDLPVWALEGILHEALAGAEGEPWEEPRLASTPPPAITRDDAPVMSSVETPPPDALRTAALQNAMDDAKGNGKSSAPAPKS